MKNKHHIYGVRSSDSVTYFNKVIVHLFDDIKKASAIDALFFCNMSCNS